MFVSKKRGMVSAILALLLVFYAFNFVPRNINIIATRSLPVKIADFAFNSALFFIVFYLLLTLGAYISKKIFPKSK